MASPILWYCFLRQVRLLSANQAFQYPPAGSEDAQDREARDKNGAPLLTVCYVRDS
jgi:hypothetical protein